MNDLETIYVQETKHKVQQYYKVNQIAEIMQVSEKTVKRMIGEHKMKAVKFGGSVRIPYSELVKNIRERY